MLSSLLCLLLHTATAHPDLNDTKIRLQQNIEDTPDNAELYISLAHILWQQNHSKKALRQLEKVAHLPNPPAALWLLRGEILAQQQKYKEAQVDLEIFLQKEPLSAKGAYTFGMILQKNNQPQRALKQIIKASRKDPRPQYYLDAIRIAESLQQSKLISELLQEAWHACGGASVIATEMKRRNVPLPSNARRPPPSLLPSPLAPGPTALERTPYLQKVYHDQVTIVWKTQSVSSGQVLYGSDPNNLTQTVNSSSNSQQHEVIS